ncbi:centrosomal protein of 192 kDa isoform X1 [Lethenteron reissneri]|uniref:centrosomal protein of 192 kDa isoform X1 n=1 Tax=Lethenteron reissneri TaxID=7753 RepID=UPI002AB78DED|nr:centrosomal protein of 192 kDa isoform X1 [Lethenteron reissneri]
MASGGSTRSSVGNLSDETFPSFLSESAPDSLGPPVAISTAARKEGSDDRTSDVHESYLEESLAVCSTSGAFRDPTHLLGDLSQHKFALSFKDDLSDANDLASLRLSDMLLPVELEAGRFHGSCHRPPASPPLPPHASCRLTALQGEPSAGNCGQTTGDTSLGLLPLDLVDDLSCGLMTLTDRMVPGTELRAQTDIQRLLASPSSAPDDSLCSFEQNELQQHGDGDGNGDDPELEELKEYEFSKDDIRSLLQQQEQQQLEGRLQGQGLATAGSLREPPWLGAVGPVKGGGYKLTPALGATLFQDAFEMPRRRVAGAGRDCAHTSDDEYDKDDNDHEFDDVVVGGRDFPVRRMDTNGAILVCNRPGLEGGSSDEAERDGRPRACGSTGLMEVAAMEPRSSAEGWHRAASPDAGSGESGEARGREHGDGNGGWCVDASPPEPCLLTRSVAGEEVRTQATPWGSLHLQRLVCGEREGEAEGENDNDEARDSNESDEGQGEGLDSMYLLPNSTAWLGGRMSGDVTGVEPVSSTSLFRSDIRPPQERRDWTRIKEEQAHGGPDVCPGVVYQDERGEWVTDLAFFTPLDTLTDTYGGLAHATSNDGDFISGNDVAALMDADEEAFLKENPFTQLETCEGAMVPTTADGGSVDDITAAAATLADVTLGMGDSSWRLLPDGHMQLRASLAPDGGGDEEEADAYMRLSLGTFIRQRSEALGSLWGNAASSMRPSFGYDIVSPERRAPFALLRMSDASSCCSDATAERTLQDGRDDGEDSGDGAELTLFPVSVEEAVSPAPIPSQTVLLSPARTPSSEEAGRRGASGREQGQKGDGAATHPEESVLHISSIASAIANASLNADPMQLAAMIMHLSNKGHRAQPPGAVTSPTQCPLAPDSRQLLSVEPRENLTAPPPSSMSSSSSVAPSGVKPREQDAGSGSQAPDDGADALKSVTPESPLILSPFGAVCEASAAVSLTDEPLSVSAWCASVFGAGGGSVLAEESRILERTFDLEKYLKQVSLYDDGNENTKEERGSVNFAATAKHATFATTAAVIAPDPSTAIPAREPGDETLTSPPLSRVARPGDARERRSRGAGPKDGPPPVSARGSMVGVEARAEKPSTSERSARPSDLRQKESKVSASRRASGAKTTAKREKVGERTVIVGGDSLVPGATIGVEQLLAGTGGQSRTQQDGTWSHKGERNVLQRDVRTAGNSTDEHNLGSSEPRGGQPEETFLFRPSTSPLSHSSPGQGSDTSNSPSTNTAPSVVREDRTGGTSVPCATPSVNGPVGHASPTSPCDPSLSRLTYLSEGDSTLQNSICFPPHPISTTKCNELSTTIVSSSPTPDLDATLTPASSGVELQHSPHQTLRLSSTTSYHHVASSGTIRLPPDRVTDPGKLAAPLRVLASNAVPTLLTAQPLMSSAALVQGYLTDNITADYPGALATPHYTVPPAPTVPLPSSCHLHCVAGVTGAAFPTAGFMSSVPAVSCTAASAGLYSMPSLAGILQGAQHGLLPGTHSGMVHMLDLGATPCRVLVPEELGFPNACCVGIAAQTSLNVYNPTERWLQVSLCLLSTSIDGEKVEGESQQCLVFKSQTVLGPRSSEDVRVLLVPRRAGVHVCVLSVASWPVAATPVDVAHAGALASRVLLTALAQHPHVQLEAGSGQGVEFGDVQWGTARVLPVRLTNRTRATVPVRLVISANAVAWRCFTFSRSDPETASNPTTEALSAPSIINLVMHAAHSAQEAESQAATLWICFRAPARHGSRTDAVGPVEHFSARVDVELDSPGPSTVVSSLPLRARVGVARVHAPKHLQTLEFLARPGTSTVRKLPLQNVGNINVELSMKVVFPGVAFSVQPSTLHLSAGQESDLSVSFALSDDNICPAHGLLQILVLPMGPQYEVCLKGEVQHPSPLLNIPPLLSNKQFLSWGGVSLGRATQQKLTLRNNSETASLPLRMVIRGQDHDCFQLQSTFGREERLSSARELVLGPRQDVPVRLLFVPTRRTCMLAKLEIKQSGTRSTVPGVKFTIPLSGYGGCSHVLLEGARRMSDSYAAVLRDVADGRVSSTRVRLRNAGTRAAFVRAVCFGDMQAREVADGSVFTISPGHFVLKERAEQEVELTCRATARESALCNTSTALLAVVCFFCGDEITRQLFRRAVAQTDGRWKPALSEENPLRAVDFHVPFPGEEAVTEVYDLPERPNDAASFYSHMSRVLLSLAGRAVQPGAAADTDTVDTGYADSLEDTAQAETHLRDDGGQRRSTSREGEAQRATRQHGSTSLDVLPVRGPQSEGAAAGVEASAWSAEPTLLLLPAPTIGYSEGRVTLRNHTSRALPFELSWPAHCLTVTPHQGVLDPQGALLILVSPTSSTSAKTKLPWSGRLYVHCDNQQQVVRVQIREDLVQADMVSPGPAVGRTLAVPHATPATPAIPPAMPPALLATPSIQARRSLPLPVLGGVEVSNKTVYFPATRVGETSKAALEFTNRGTEEVKWYLTSFAPPYVKGVAGSGDVFRATYSTFRFSRMAGTLEAAGKATVWAEFMPRDGGRYAQFWDLECHPEGHTHLRDHTRVQLSAEALGETLGGGTDAEAVPVGLVKTAPAPSPPRARDGTELPTPAQHSHGCPAHEDGKGSAGATATTTAAGGLYVPRESYSFPQTELGSSSTVKVSIRNKTSQPHTLKFVCTRAPFHIQHSNHLIRAQHYVNLPVQFKPLVAGTSEGLLVIETAPGSSLSVRLHGEAIAAPQ